MARKGAVRAQTPIMPRDLGPWLLFILCAGIAGGRINLNGKFGKRPYYLSSAIKVTISDPILVERIACWLHSSIRARP